MVIKGTPKNIDNYIKTDNILGRYLQGKGFYPEYIDSDYIYFYVTKEIEIALLEYDKVVSKK